MKAIKVPGTENDAAQNGPRTPPGIVTDCLHRRQQKLTGLPAARLASTCGDGGN